MTILPGCRFLIDVYDGTGLRFCKNPAKYWDCSDPVGGPVCFKHCCKRCGGKDGIELSQEELDNFLKEESTND